MSVLLKSLRKGDPLATNTALILLGWITVELCRSGVGEFHHFVHGFSETVFGQLAIYFGAIFLVEHCPASKWTLRIILAVALAARLMCVFAPPFLSTDVYRYVWDGKVQAAGINPFRYIPADSHLSFLRDSGIYPNINRAGYARTIYPPGAQAIFLAVTRLRATVPFMKLAMVGFEAATCLILLRVFKILGLKPERIVLYAWHPLCFWEIASSGHVDAAALTFLTLAIYARLKDKAGWVGALLGAATLVKLYPASLLPAFLQSSKAYRFNLKTPAIFTGIVAAGYACYASVGSEVFGFLPAYAQEEGLQSGDRYFLLTLVNRTLHRAIPPVCYVALCASIVAAVCIWAMTRGQKPYGFIFSAVVLATVLNVFYSPHYPWYFLWLLPYLAIVPWRPAFYLVAASAYLFGTNLGTPGEPMFHLNILLYSGFAFMLGYDLLGRIPRWFAFAPERQPGLESPSLIHTTATARNS